LASFHGKLAFSPTAPAGSQRSQLEKFMVKRLFLGIVASFVLAGIIRVRGAGAQQPKQVPRIAYVYIFKEGPSAPWVQAFRERLRGLGWIDGQNIVVEVRDADGSFEKLDAIMRHRQQRVECGR